MSSTDVVVTVEHDSVGRCFSVVSRWRRADDGRVTRKTYDEIEVLDLDRVPLGVAKALGIDPDL